MKILFYFSDHNANVIRREQNKWGGVGYYRIIKPSQLVKGHEVTVWGTELVKKDETPEERWHRVFTQFDVFWTSYFSDPKEASALFYTRDKFNKLIDEGKMPGPKKKVVIDCDDNYLDVHPSHPLYHKIKAAKRDKAFMSTIISFADVVTVSTIPLKQRFQKHFKEVHGLDKTIFVIPNMNDITEWNYTPVAKDPDKFIIGYAGSNSHQDDLEMFLDSLQKIMEKYPHVHFESVGSFSKDMLPMFYKFTSDQINRVDLLPPTWTYDEYPKMISEQKWNIGVCPLVDTAFTRCKSHIKWMDYSMFKIPVIASRVYPYFMDIGNRHTIEHEKTGLLVKPSEWFDAMESLILDEKKRTTLGENAYNYIKDNWQYKDSDISETIDKILAL